MHALSQTIFAFIVAIAGLAALVWESRNAEQRRAIPVRVRGRTGRRR